MAPRPAATADCVQQAANGDVRAFEELSSAHLPRIHSLVRRMTGGRDADKLTQDVFVRVWQKLGSFRGDSAFGTWLHRLAVNVVIQRFRTDTARRQRLVDGEAIFETLSAPPRAARHPHGLRGGAPKAPRRRPRDLVLHDIEGLQAPAKSRRSSGSLRRVEGATASRPHDAAETPPLSAQDSSMPTHDVLNERLSEYLDNELDAAGRAEVEAHLAECGRCRRRPSGARRCRRTRRYADGCGPGSCG